MNKSTGICIGANSIKIVEMDSDYRITNRVIRNHDCNPKEMLGKVIRELDLETSFVTVTGRKFKNLLNLPTITEPEASEYALKHVGGNGQSYNALVSLGGENFIVYVLDSHRGITQVKAGNKCASGTGEFFLQQIRRMGVDVDEAVELALSSEPHRVSGRCSVFCKSDCTHALNKGIPTGEVCSGLAEMIAEKVIDIMQAVERKDIILAGGVTKNRSVVEKLGTKIQNLHIPEEAEVFEAWGAAIYALDNQKRANGRVEVRTGANSFSALPPLEEFRDWVTFNEADTGVARDGDRCILGLDVGSTTTKAVLLRTEDNAVLASIYLRTRGNPVRASRECYQAIHEQLKGTRVSIKGLGVCGSGRKIAGLHALTDGIINEIIAHATGATYYDPGVDTILEIGGQDAKYTYLVNGVPCDYAMNEACSAGTGSFLEEAAKESLNIDYLDIQDIALTGMAPPNFNDQCAAFISSDIKNAGHESIPQEDIVAGLVYSICMNYTNRVKGARKVGDKVFMQGGVCYNKAVPLAMAALLKKPIVVPPEPGLTGAFGVALEVKNRIESGLLEEDDFDLEALIAREVEYGKTFTCPGTQENCDRGCQINVIKMNGKSYAFGGICNKYYNILHKVEVDTDALDYVARRQEIFFEIDGNGVGVEPGLRTVGIQTSFYLHNLFPLYHTFLSELGFEVVLADEPDPDGVKMTSSAFCYPGEIAHGMFKNLLEKKPDIIILPKVAQLPVDGRGAKGWAEQSTCCMGAQEPYYIQSAFRDIPVPLLTPILDFSEGWGSQEEKFIEMGRELGRDPEASARAYRAGVARQERFQRKKKELGDKLLRELEADPDSVAVVLFGRTYNAFAEEANFGIPRKFASRGYRVLPYECLRYEEEESLPNMSWAAGHEIIRAARFVKKHPQLFAAFVTNFSCGPDSFLVGYVRDIMGNKPSLTLELDNHTADAGVNTRVEAFLDIVRRYRQLGVQDSVVEPFTPAKVLNREGRFVYQGSDGSECDFKGGEVKLLVPSMGSLSAGLTAAAFRGLGFQSEPLDIPKFPTLMLGRANTSCKECLPLILTTAGILDYVQNKKEPGEKVAFLMPRASGACRLPQYVTFQESLIEKKQLPDVCLFGLANEDNFAGFSLGEYADLFRAIIAADVLDEIRNALLVLPKDREAAMAVFEEELADILDAAEKNGKAFYRQLKKSAKRFRAIELRFPLEEAKRVLLDGEIYVRKDEFTTQGVVDKLAARDIVTKRAPVLEWLRFVGYHNLHFQKGDESFKTKRDLFIRNFLIKHLERKVKRILGRSGLCDPHVLDIEGVVKDGSNFVDTHIVGEILLVIGGFFQESANHVHGVLNVGPFACLPTRIVESILTQESKIEGNARIRGVQNYEKLKDHHVLPYLSIEMDGNPLPQVVDARLEAFTLQVEKVHQKMNGGDGKRDGASVLGRLGLWKGGRPPGVVQGWGGEGEEQGRKKNGGRIRLPVLGDQTRETQRQEDPWQ